ncbi:MAG: DinB family protein [Acidimicrobiia bacterium]|nr:DinB family protein [Acidimicrobiia bacterium]
MDDETPWEPPLAGTEVEHLLGALDRLRATFRWKVDGLDSDGLKATLGSSTLTLGGLLKHLALVEDHASTMRLDGRPMDSIWASAARADDWEFSSAAHDDPGTLYSLWDSTVERSRERFDRALDDGGPSQLVNIRWPDGRQASLRRLLFDLVEEYGRHTGHADLLREHVDGRTGEDPPPGWRPTTPAA